MLKLYISTYNNILNVVSCMYVKPGCAALLTASTSCLSKGGRADFTRSSTSVRLHELGKHSPR